jgi:hypothetical protein
MPDMADSRSTEALKAQATALLMRRVPDSVLSGPAELARRYRENAAILSRFLAGEVPTYRAAEAARVLHHAQVRT